MICDDGVKLPRRATDESSGYDIYAPRDMMVTTRPQTFDLGFRFEYGDLARNSCAILMPRSSTGNKQGLHIRGTIGLIDSDYHDNVLATLVADEGCIGYRKDDRILQFFIINTGILPNEIVPTDKRSGGYGSTGVR